MKETIIGIDPGFKGGICIMSRETGSILSCFPMPIIKIKMTVKTKKGNDRYKKEINVRNIRHMIEECIEKSVGLFLVRHKIKVFMEDVHAMPAGGKEDGTGNRQGIVSTFNFGMGFGELKGFIKTMGFLYYLVSPLKWKNAILKGICFADKGIVSRVATDMSGGYKFLATGRSKVLHDGMAESYLIAEYGRRSLEYDERLRAVQQG